MEKRITWYKVYDFNRDGKTPQAAGSARTIDIEGKRFCMAFTGKKYYTLDDRCPHAGGRFGMGGWCDDHELVCPVHRYRFNLESGQGGLGDYINTYPTEERPDGVYIGLERKSKWWWPF